MADPVVAGVLFVLLESSVVSEPLVTAIAISHQVVVVQRKEWKWDGSRGPIYDSSPCFNRVCTELLCGESFSCPSTDL